MTRRSRSADDRRSQKAISRRSKPACACASLAGVIERREIVEDAGADAALLEHIEIEQIDRQDVVERLLDRREEAGARRLELARLQRQHGAIEPVVGPEIVAGHAAEMLEQVHRFTCCTQRIASRHQRQNRRQ